MLDPEQQQKRLLTCGNSILQGTHRKELEEELVQCQGQSTEVNARTAELYSEQGNSHVTEHMVIDEIIQCKSLHNTQ